MGLNPHPANNAIHPKPRIMFQHRSSNRHTPLWDYPEVAQAIGILTGEWSALEYTLFWVFGNLIDGQHDLADSMYYSLASNKARTDLVASAIMHKYKEGSEERESLLEIIKDIRDLSNCRNSIAHDQWGIDNKSRLIRKPNRTRRKPKQNIYETPDNLYKLIEDICNLRISLVFLSHGVRASEHDSSLDPPEYPPFHPIEKTCRNPPKN